MQQILINCAYGFTAHLRIGEYILGFEEDKPGRASWLFRNFHTVTLFCNGVEIGKKRGVYVPGGLNINKAKKLLDKMVEEKSKTI